ncbi:hypothetical protein L210DRAFT_3760506 [Boletus edulis BED1]|uniref:Receptor-activated Ca2+-permeable cation channel n=1 Tax=Boletus edulis BED1 TaxID=1328754 RepID=A0AAD4BV93_BOLED|nr:hypothetical protein L210DRAFT_3760506 [Boletus edulis BED1]
MDFEEQPELNHDQPAAPTQDFLATVKVFPLILYLKKDVTSSIDTPLSWDQLAAADVNFALVRPLVLKYARLQNMAVVYACMVARSYFLSQAATELALSSVLLSRATLCEILALKLLTYFASSKLQLVAVLTTLWNPLAGAPLDVVEEVKEVIGREEAPESSQSAIEMAIATRAKAFLASTIVQTIVDDVYTGRIVFTVAANRSLVADNYKQRAIEMYDVRKAPFLDHYRLRVPRYSNILHSFSIAMLTLIFVLCLRTQQTDSVSTWELIFLVFATAFTLQEYTASREYGWRIYIANVWNAFDTSFVLVFLAYAGLRTKGLIYREADTSKLAFDLLACGACILIPRLAFYAIASNVIVLTLRAMISEFVFFVCIAATCFSGLLLTLCTLASDEWTVRGIAWLMLQIWFGNTSLSFSTATSFHPVLGPILMTCFAALANTLLLTILISILSNTAARIGENSNQEYLFHHAITTIEGVKSDALFSYQPPFNILAFLILKPTSYVLSPRSLHSANVFLIKLTSFPILIIIALYERRLACDQKMKEFKKDSKYTFYQSLPRHLKNMPLVEYLVGSKSTDLYDVIFEVEESRDFSLFHDPEDEDARTTVSVLPASPLSPSPSRGRTSLLDSQQAPRSPRKRKVSTLTPLQEVSSNAKLLSLDTNTPLSRLYSPARPVTAIDHEDECHHLHRMQSLLDQYRDLPIRCLQDEVKEMQDRQRRIEDLLLTLTRGL